MSALFQRSMYSIESVYGLHFEAPNLGMSVTHTQYMMWQLRKHTLPCSTLVVNSLKSKAVRRMKHIAAQGTGCETTSCDRPTSITTAIGPMLSPIKLQHTDSHLHRTGYSTTRPSGDDDRCVNNTSATVSFPSLAAACKHVLPAYTTRK
jgi:hypothetical protein